MERPKSREETPKVGCSRASVTQRVCTIVYACVRARTQ